VIESYLRLVALNSIECPDDGTNDYVDIKADKLGPISELEEVLSAD